MGGRGRSEGFESLAEEHDFAPMDDVADFFGGELADDPAERELDELSPGSAFAKGGAEIQDRGRDDGVAREDRADGSTLHDFGDLTWEQDLEGGARIDAGPFGCFVLSPDGVLTSERSGAAAWSLGEDGTVHIVRDSGVATRLSPSGRREDTDEAGGRRSWATDGGLDAAARRGEHQFDPEELEEGRLEVWRRRLVVPVLLGGLAVGGAVALQQLDETEEAPPSGASRLAAADVAEPLSPEPELYCSAVLPVAEHLADLDAALVASATDEGADVAALPPLGAEHERRVALAIEHTAAEGAPSWEAHGSAVAEAVALLDEQGGDMDAYLVVEPPELEQALADGFAFVRAERDACVVSGALGPRGGEG